MMMSDRIVTVTVPPALYDHLQRRAVQRQRSLEEELLLTLADAVPTDTDTPAELALLLASLPTLDEPTLWQLAQARVDATDAARLADLGDKRQRIGLTADEEREAEELVQRHDRVLMLRAEAAAMLKRRGHDVSRLAPDG
jgi:hypothetical protein